MTLMGIKNTQFILVRHHNTDNPHCHLVYNRIGYDLSLIHIYCATNPFHEIGSAKNSVSSRG